MPAAVLAQSGGQLIIHYVEGQPLSGQVGYAVNVYLSALDATGNPILNATKDNFTLSEDSRQVEIQSVTKSDNLPINLLLLLDTSGSMQGDPIADARKAASTFINSLIETDRIALYSFNEKVTQLSDFTSDRQTAAQKVGTISAINLASTCLYDAAYEAVQKAATISAGRRAIILLTDGTDIKGAGPCSVHTIDDLIGLASAGSTRVPIHVIGLGREVDQKTLERIAQMSGGQFQYTPNSSQLSEVFTRLSSQLRSELVLSYNSTGAPGSHTVVAQLKYDTLSMQDSRSFLLPALPSQVIILSPTEGQEVKGKVKVAASVTGQGQVVQSVVFRSGSQEIGKDETVPYEIEWDASKAANGTQSLTVTAYGSDGKELASSSISIKVSGGSGTAPAASTSTSIFSNPAVLIGLIALVAAGGGLAFFLSRRKKPTVVEPDDFELKSKKGGGESDRTMDFRLTPQEGGTDALATLTILASDDAGMLQQVLNISKYPTLIGRHPECDVVVTKADQPVSRRHAWIELNGGKPSLREEIGVDETTGAPKPPTYGTFVNEKPVPAGGIALHDGDEIRLGTRFCMRFNLGKKAAQGSSDKTIDFSTLKDQGEKTREVPRD